MDGDDLDNVETSLSFTSPRRPKSDLFQRFNEIDGGEEDNMSYDGLESTTDNNKYNVDNISFDDLDNIDLDSYLTDAADGSKSPVEEPSVTSSNLKGDQNLPTTAEPAETSPKTPDKQPMFRDMTKVVDNLQKDKNERIDSKIKELELEYQKKLSNAKEEVAAEERKSYDLKLRENLNKLRTGFKKEKNNWEVDFKNRLNSEKEEHLLTVQSLKTEYEQKLKSSSQTLETTKNEEIENLKTQISTLESQLTRKDSGFQERLTGELKECKVEYEKITTEQKKELALLQQSHDDLSHKNQELSTQVKELSKKLSSAQNVAVTREVEELEKQHQIKLQTQFEEHSKHLEIMAKQKLATIENHKKEKVALNQKHKESMEKLAEDLDQKRIVDVEEQRLSVENKWEEKVKILRENFETERVEMERKFELQMLENEKKVTTERDEAIRKKQEDFDNLMSIKQEEIHNEYLEKKKKMDEKHEKEVMEMQQSLSIGQNRQKNEFESFKKRKIQELEEKTKLIETYEKKIQELEQKNKKLEQNDANLKKRLSEEYKDSVRKLTVSFSDFGIYLAKKFVSEEDPTSVMSRMNEIEKKLEKVKPKKDDILKKLSKYHTSQTTKYEALKTLNEEKGKKISDLEKELKTNEGKFMTELSSLRMSHRKDVSNLKKNHSETMDQSISSSTRQIEEMRKNHKTEIQAQSEELKEKHKTEIQKLLVSQSESENYFNSVIQELEGMVYEGIESSSSVQEKLETFELVFEEMKKNSEGSENEKRRIRDLSSSQVRLVNQNSFLEEEVKDLKMENKEIRKKLSECLKVHHKYVFDDDDDVEDFELDGIQKRRMKKKKNDDVEEEEEEEDGEDEDFEDEDGENFKSWDNSEMNISWMIGSPRTVRRGKTKF